MMQYETIVGMEIHVELKTQSKMFCGCVNDPFHAKEPNIYTCPVCLGMPGGLPIPNEKAIEWTVMIGLALGCEITELSKFDRKNYFYPDLAKGYQISQYDKPFCRNGKIETSMGPVRIHRVHLEEDTAKLQHQTVDGDDVTLVDFNRSGVPLVEIVTEADIRSGDQAKEFLKKLHQIIRYLGVSDADMEKGSMRLEPNISVRPIGEKELPAYKVEVKNINSFNFVKKAIEFETERHIGLLSKGVVPVQETRGWNENKNATISQRLKETADDYRYFPDPDIPPIKLAKDYIEEIRTHIPELPEAVKARYMKSYALSGDTAEILAYDMVISKYFEDCVREDLVDARDIANWIVNKRGDMSLTPKEFVHGIRKLKEESNVSPEELTLHVHAVLSENGKAVTDYKNGKKQVIMFLMGLVFRRMGKKPDSKTVLTALEQALNTT